MQGRKRGHGVRAGGCNTAAKGLGRMGEGERSKMASHMATHLTVHTRARDRKVEEGGRGGVYRSTRVGLEVNR